MLLNNCEINRILTWPAKCIIAVATEATKFARTDTNLYVLVVMISTEYTTKLLEEVKL